MAIRLMYYTIVIPISTVLFKYVDGWEAWIEKNRDCYGPMWNDDYLYARATMDPYAFEKIKLLWEQCGFTGEGEEESERVWIDFCIPESAPRCEWLSFTENVPAVYLTGTEPGKVVVPTKSNKI